jgi:hypothetical protein
MSETTTSEHFKRKHVRELNFPRNGGVSFACIGSTRSGKSHCVSFLYDEFFKKHITILETLSNHSEIYKPFKKTGIICEGFHPELIQEGMLVNKRTECHYNFLYIFDDLAMDGKNNSMMTKLLTVGRNFFCSAIISGQKATLLSATGRSNINYLCLFYQNSDTECEFTIKAFLRSFFPRGMKMIDCIRMYKELTQNHNFFLVDTLNNECFLSRI